MLDSPIIDFEDLTEVKHFVEIALAENQSRVKHVLEIWQRVKESATILKLSASEVDLAERAALLHDIGYWPSIALTGFHPVDGARFLEQHRAENIAKLIIGHSCSPEEGELLGFSGIEQDESLIAKLITYWDVQVKQGGKVVSYEERFRDIIQRYGESSTVGKANIKAKPRIEKILKEVDELVALSTTSLISERIFGKD